MHFQDRIRSCRIKTLFCAILCLVAITIFFYYWGIAELIINTAYKIGVASPRFESHNIFFLETSGANNLSARQACAIESTARYLPESEIRVLMFTSGPFKDTHNLTGIFDNVYVNATTFEKIFEDTPLLQWYRNKEWNGSRYRIHHLSDASRLAVIWKYGGMYLDLDIVMLTSLSVFWHRNMTNFLIKEKDNSLCNGIFGFSRRHPFLHKCILNVLERYRRDCWSCIGPKLITDQFNSYCSELNMTLIETGIHCNVTILPVISAFPIPYQNWKDYFTNNSIDNVISKIRESYMIHVWNFLSSKEMLRPGIDAAYGKVMSVHCPHVYKHAIEIGLPF